MCGLRTLKRKERTTGVWNGAVRRKTVLLRVFSLILHVFKTSAARSRLRRSVTLCAYAARFSHLRLLVRQFRISRISQTKGMAAALALNPPLMKIDFSLHW